MRQIVLLLTISGAAFGQSMLESGAVMAGTAVGSAAGKKVSQGVSASLRKTGSILDAASKTNGKSAKASLTAPAIPMLQVGAGVPKPEVNNVPPPPPPKRRAASPQPARTRAVSVPVVMSAVVPEASPQHPVNVDLSGVSRGMPRENLLALGTPSARITMYEDGHIEEIYQYRNQTLASGTVRLRDGAVSTIDARP